MPRVSWIGCVLAVPLERDAGFGALQIVAEGKAGLTAVALEGVWPTPPTLAEAVAGGPLFAQRGSRILALNLLEAHPPPVFARLGVAAPVWSPEEPVRSYGSVQGFRASIAREQAWRALGPTERARLEARRWRHDPTEVVLALGAGELRVRRDSSRVHLAGPAFDPAAPVEWSASRRCPSSPSWTTRARTSGPRRLAWVAGIERPGAGGAG
ncbi:MAG: hypothetical protein R3F43_12250 [bacterium]